MNLERCKSLSFLWLGLGAICFILIATSSALAQSRNCRWAIVSLSNEIKLYSFTFNPRESNGMPTKIAMCKSGRQAHLPFVGRACLLVEFVPSLAMIVTTLSDQAPRIRLLTTTMAIPSTTATWFTRLDSLMAGLQSSQLSCDSNGE